MLLHNLLYGHSVCKGNQTHVCLILKCTQLPLSNVVPYMGSFQTHDFRLELAISGMSKLLDISMPIHNTLDIPAFFDKGKI